MELNFNKVNKVNRCKVAVNSENVDRITRAEYARHAGTGRPAVTKMVRNGKVPVYVPRKLINLSYERLPLSGA